MNAGKLMRFMTVRSRQRPILAITKVAAGDASLSGERGQLLRIDGSYRND